MKIAVIADIHGNLEAFKQVLLDIEQSRVEAVVCLGDCIGYGPEPDEVVSLVRELNMSCIMGNHELGLVDRDYLDWFNEPTRESLLLTHDLLSWETLEFLKGLKPAMVLDGCRFVHGCPPDSMTTYMFEIAEHELAAIFASTKERLCFVGHTHTLEIIESDGKRISRDKLRQGLRKISENSRYIVNVGSVGQPRDGNMKAKYVVWDSSDQTIDVRFVPYDIAVTTRKILELGFPELNAKRLW
jgi:predicted phosphodiesterase